MSAWSWVARVALSGAMKASVHVAHWARRVLSSVAVSLVQFTSGWVGVPWPRPLPPQAIQLRRYGSPAVNAPPKPIT